MFLLLFISTIAFGASKTEVQINICDSYESVSNKLDLKNWKQKNPEKTYFIESKNLELYKQNWVFKVTIDSQKKTAEVSLKLNQATSDKYAEKCENDLHGDTKKVACKLTNSISYDEFEHVQKNENYISLLSNEQLSWLTENHIEIPDNAKMTSAFEDQDFVDKSDGLKMVLGVSLSKKKDEFIEFSARSEEASEKETQKQLLKYLKKQNVNICKDQSSMHTRMKLESYFHRTLHLLSSLL